MKFHKFLLHWYPSTHPAHSVIRYLFRQSAIRFWSNIQHCFYLYPPVKIYYSGSVLIHNFAGTYQPVLHKQCFYLKSLYLFLIIIFKRLYIRGPLKISILQFFRDITFCFSHSSFAPFAESDFLFSLPHPLIHPTTIAVTTSRLTSFFSIVFLLFCILFNLF